MKIFAKKLLAVLLAAMMIIPLFVVGASAISTGATIVVSEVSGEVGDVVEVAVSLENNPGFVVMMLDVDYDSTALKLVGVEDSGLISGKMHSSDYTLNPYQLTWDNPTVPENIKANGTIAVLKFEILSTAAAGKYDIEVSYDLSNDYIYDVDLDPVEFAVVNGSVTVTKSSEVTTEATIVVSEVSGEVGDVVEVAVSLENNPGFVVMMLDVDYDDTVLKLVGVEDSGLISGKMHSSDYTLNPYQLTWDNPTIPENIKANGTIAVLKFEILSTAATGKYDIEVSYDLSNDYIYDVDLDPVEFAVINGSVTVIKYCNHEYAINRYNGLMTCSECDEVCAHENWTNSVCDSCGLACTHDWSYKGNVATCAICAKTCASHAKKGLFLDCATCGYDMAIANSYYEGNSMITDTDNTLETAHGFKMNLQLTVGSDGTIFNTKDTSRDDNVYYSATEQSGNASDYYSLVTWVFAKTGASATYRTLFSLWLDTTNEFSSRVDGDAPDGFVEPKLWVTVAADSTKKICEIKAGETYDVTMYYDVANGWCILEVKLDGEIIGSYKLNASDFSGTLSSSKIRLGETYAAKRLHVQKISFEDVIFSDTYENGACYVCGIECTHRYNVGGYCADCGVLGDPITFNDKTGTSSFSITGNNIGAYKSSNTSTVGIWQFFDDTEMLLGHDYVMNMDVKFTEAVYNASSTNGSTSRFIIWADANVATTTQNTRFGIFIRTLADDDQVVLLGFKDSFKETDPHITLNLNEKHNLRIAVRSTPTTTVGTYNNTAEVYFDGALVYTQTFTLTAADGMAVRIGDHVARMCCARSEIDSTFGIRFLDSTPEYIGAQEKENADYSSDDKFDIRFVFGFDDLYLEDVGVKVEASVSDGTSGEKILSAGSKALKAVSVGGVTKQVGVNGVGYGGYYMATAITDIDLDLDSVYTFVLTPYIEKQYATELTYMPYSYEITVSFDDNAKMVIDYKKIG